MDLADAVNIVSLVARGGEKREGGSRVRAAGRGEGGLSLALSRLEVGGCLEVELILRIPRLRLRIRWFTRRRNLTEVLDVL